METPLVFESIDYGSMAGQVIKEERDGFDFAVAVTKKTKFEGESAAEFYKNGGRVSLVYEI